MAIDTQRRPTARASRSLAPPPKRQRGRGFMIAAGVIVVVLAGAYFALRAGSGASLSGDPVALARVETGPFGGSIRSVRAYGPNGKKIPIHVSGNRITPRAGVVAPGESVSVQVVIRRPGSVGWLLGKESRQRLTLTAPAAHLASPRITTRPGSRLSVGFDKPVTAVAYGLPKPGSRHELGSARKTVALPSRDQAGTIEVASAARSWERVGPAEQLAWFPPTRSTALIAYPGTGSRISPTSRLRLIFSKPVDHANPSIAPSVPGRWSRPDDHTLLFTPSGNGVPLGTHVQVTLPHAAAVSTHGAGALRSTRTLDWTVPPGSTLRLHQLLAQAGYLPLDWKPAGHEVRRTVAAQNVAAVQPPSGTFTWRYGNEPSELRAMWQPGSANNITRGAIMAFQSRHGLTADGFAGPQLWAALIADTVHGKHVTGGYSYVYVHRDASHQTLTLWHNGHNVITSPGNTGVAAAPTQLGTFPVFEHLAETTMTGNNPDGSHYSDPGIKWVSYFNGGDALHAFDRASFGTPQSVGCVELPLASAAKIWPYTPIGTLVTIEH